MLTNFRRIIKFGCQGFWRNKGLSLQVIFIMVVAILLLTSLFIFKSLSNFLMSKVEDKINVAVYFKEDVSEDQILQIREKLDQFSAEIERIDYVSKDEAKEIFVERHEDEPLYLKALEEVGQNPFLASLNIKAKSPLFYGQISSFIQEGPFQNLVEKVSYYKTQEVIDKLFILTNDIKKAGFWLSIFLIVLVFLITFNTVKLTIFSFRDEIATMRLVGAPNRFIRGPFVFQGLFYGVLSVLIVDILLFSFFYFTNKEFQEWLFQFSMLGYLKNNFFSLLLWQSIFGIFLGGASSFLAVRKYLRI